jgi:hypothetical protein
MLGNVTFFFSLVVVVVAFGTHFYKYRGSDGSSNTGRLSIFFYQGDSRSLLMVFHFLMSVAKNVNARDSAIGQVRPSHIHTL